MGSFCPGRVRRRIGTDESNRRASDKTNPTRLRHDKGRRLPGELAASQDLMSPMPAPDGQIPRRNLTFPPGVTGSGAIYSGDSNRLFVRRLIVWTIRVICIACRQRLAS